MINLKLLFTNTTQYTKDVYNEFLGFHSHKYHFTYVTYTVAVTAFILFGLILQVKYHNLSIAILLCCGLTGFILWRYFRPISTVKKEYESEKIRQEQKFTFKFYQKYFTIEDNKQYSNFKYYRLYKAFETPSFFYLYIDKTHAFLISKACFKKNNPEEFSKFIKKKCWWCYKYVKRKLT